MRIEITFPLLLLLLAVNATSGFGQGSGLSIRGVLRHHDPETLERVIVSLRRASDSNVVKYENAERDGAFLFEQIPAGRYFITAQGSGYEQYGGPGFELNDNMELPPVLLEKRTATVLKEAVVISSQPLIQREFEKTVVNVAASIQAAGNTAFDVLRQAPGVNIDQNDNISMRGRAGVMVMIDGKRIFMSGAELANMLRGTAANAIDRIELITNPSAKYDAQGSGIINIRLKKEARRGTNGTLTGSFGHGQFPKAAAGISVNHRSGNLNLFASYNYTYREDFIDLRLDRSFYQQDNFTGAYSQKNYFNYRNNSHNLRLGADLNLSKKTVVGIVGGGMVHDSKRWNENISKVFDEQRVYRSSFLTSGDNRLGRSNAFVNLNLRHSFDTTGTELSVDLDFANYGSGDRQDYDTRYYDLAGQLTRPHYLLHGDLRGALNIYSLKADYNRRIGKKVKMEAGVKSSLVAADNDLQFRDRSNGGNIPDSTKSNHFLYDENINAAYANLSGSAGKLDWQTGLRAENTNVRGRQLTDGQSFNRSYTQLFPNLYLGYHLHPKHDLGVSLSRRINRPTYNQLNPFKYFLDPSTYSAGNPYLNPELSIITELTYTFRQRYIVQLGYNHTDRNMATVLVPVAGQEKVIIQTDLNTGSLDYYAATLTVPFKIGNWLSSTNTSNIYYALYRGDAANTSLHNGRTTFDFNSTNALTMGKGYAAELNMNYQSPVAYGFMTQEKIGSVSLGIQRQFQERRGSIKLNISDIFWTSKVRASNEVTGYRERFYQLRDTRHAMLSFSYRFGEQSAPSRRRTGGVEEEKRRAG